MQCHPVGHPHKCQTQIFLAVVSSSSPRYPTQICSVVTRAKLLTNLFIEKAIYNNKSKCKRVMNQVLVACILRMLAFMKILK